MQGHAKRNLQILLLGGLCGCLGMVLNGCAPKAFTKGQYDDPTRIELLNDKFGENDMQQMSEAIVKEMVSCDYIRNAPKPPVVMVDQVINDGGEHIDFKMLTNMVRSALMKTGKVRFIDRDARALVAEEYKYHEENVSGPTAKKKGRQIGADYVMKGRFGSFIQEVGSEKFVYYKITMDLVEIESTAFHCTKDYQLRKKFRKRSIGF